MKGAIKILVNDPETIEVILNKYLETNWVIILGLTTSGDKLVVIAEIGVKEV